MTSNQFDFARAFKRISEALEKLSDEEISRLSDNQFSIEIRIVRRRIKDEKNDLDHVDCENIINQLANITNREEAQLLLNLRCPSKKSLEIIARKLDLPIIKQGKIDDLRDRIVEATVGSRIRSQAIQGTNNRLV